MFSLSPPRSPLLWWAPAAGWADALGCSSCSLPRQICIWGPEGKAEL